MSSQALREAFMAGWAANGADIGEDVQAAFDVWYRNACRIASRVDVGAEEEALSGKAAITLQKGSPKER